MENDLPVTYQEKFRAWAKGRPLIQTNHAITLEQAADHLDEMTASLLAKNSEIERLRAAITLAMWFIDRESPRAARDELDKALASSPSEASDERLIPVRPYPGDEEAVCEAGIDPPYCTCVARCEDGPHQQNCPFWTAILAARKIWLDANVIAWSCSSEATGRGRCEHWCGHPEYCPATGTDRRR